MLRMAHFEFMSFFVVRNIPNFISMLRILLTIPICMLLFMHQYPATFILFVIAGFSDGLDGFLAKRYGWQSRLGGLLDPLADKILFISVFLSLGIIKLIPLWLVIIVLIRDIIIISGTIFYQLTVGNVEPSPSQLSKFNTLLQTVLVIAVILDASIYSLSRVLIDCLQWLLLTTLILSGGHYVYLWGSKAINKNANLKVIN